MPITFAWEDNNTVLIAVYKGYIVGEELISAMDYFIGAMNAVEYPLHIISDHSQMTRYPFVAEFMQKSFIMLNHANMGWIAIVGGNAIMRLWIQLFQKLAPLHVAQFATQEEALQFIREQRRSAQHFLPTTL